MLEKARGTLTASRDAVIEANEAGVRASQAAGGGKNWAPIIW